MTFTPALDIVIEYKGNVGVVKFICDECITFCKYSSKVEGELSDVCIVVYRYEWDSIKLLQGHHRQ